MKQLIYTLQILVGGVLVLFILVQVKGVGFGRVWGSGGAQSFTRRGLEKLVFRLTFIVSALFAVISIVALIV